MGYSAVVDEGALAPGCGHDAGDDLEDLVVPSPEEERVVPDELRARFEDRLVDLVLDRLAGHSYRGLLLSLC